METRTNMQTRMLLTHWLITGGMLALFGLGADLLFWQGTWGFLVFGMLAAVLMRGSLQTLSILHGSVQRRPTLVGAMLYVLTGFLRCRIIRGPEGEPYLERYALFQVGSYRAFIHRFVDSDPDRGLHDHPWDKAVSLILSGSYNELRLVGAEIANRQVRAGDLNFLRGKDFHRVLLPGQFDTWSLFTHGPRAKGWGFVKHENGTPVYREVDAEATSHKSRGWARTAPIGWQASRTPLVIGNLSWQNQTKNSLSSTSSVPPAPEKQLLPLACSPCSNATGSM